MHKASKVLIIASLADSLVGFRGDLIRTLLRSGHQVYVCAPHFENDVRAVLESWGVSVFSVGLSRTGRNPFSDLRLIWQLFLVMRSVRPDIVFAYTIKPVIYGMLSAFLAGVPKRTALITGLGYAFMGEGRRAIIGWIAKALYRVALSKSHLVFFQNPDDERLFREVGILSGTVGSCVVNGSGVPIDRFTVAPFPESMSFLLIARFLGDKGIREYVAAARMIKKKFPQVRFNIVGWIDENPDAISQEELRSWLDEGVVEYAGRLADVRPAIEACSVYVLPSYREGTPRTVLEAMAMGRPIITTDAPGCRETVINGENGFLVPVRSVGALADAMEKFIQFPELLERMGRRSRMLAETRYDVRAVNTVMLRAMGLEGEIK